METAMAEPAGTVAGTRTTIWKTPATIPGAGPTYKTSAGWPLIDTDTGMGMKTAVWTIVPSLVAGGCAPRPVAYSEIIDPAEAGVPGELTVPSAFTVAAWPLPTPV